MVTYLLLQHFAIG